MVLRDSQSIEAVAKFVVFLDPGKSSSDVGDEEGAGVCQTHQLVADLLGVGHKLLAEIVEVLLLQTPVGQPPLHVGDELPDALCLEFIQLSHFAVLSRSRLTFFLYLSMADRTKSLMSRFFTSVGFCGS